VTLSGLAAEPLSIALPRESPSRQAAFCRAAERPNRTAVNRVAGCYPAAAASPRARHTAAPHCLPRRSPRCLPHRLPRQPPSRATEPSHRAEPLEPSCWSRAAGAVEPPPRHHAAVPITPWQLDSSSRTPAERQSAQCQWLSESVNARRAVAEARVRVRINGHTSR
jgi:hypothetical protein